MVASSETLTRGLVILHGNRLESLRDLAIEWVRAHPLSPLEDEVFIVQSNGMAQWLKLAFAEQKGLGISASMRFTMPSRFLWQANRMVLGADSVPETSAFDKSRLVWRIYRWLVHELPAFAEFSAAETEAPAHSFAALRAYLGDASDVAKCFGLAQRLADLFDQYQVYRADWLNDWQQGRDVLRNATGEGAFLADVSVPDGQYWQPALWRILLNETSELGQQSGRSKVHQRFLSALSLAKECESEWNLPRRIQVFGISSMSTQMLEAIAAIARHAQVMLYVLNPSPHYWMDIMDGRELLGIHRHRHAHKASLPQGLSSEKMAMRVNPLLAAWGKQGRDYIGLLYHYDANETSHRKIDFFEAPREVEGDTLLACVQDDIFELRPAPASPADRVPVAAEDLSVQFHLCHSRQREVEVLHDRLLDLMERVPDLQARDIIVMAPDIEQYAAHVDAVFGNIETDRARYIPFTLSDRRQRASHPLAAALDALLRLPDMRFSVSDVLALLDVPAVRKRFDLAETDLSTLRRWMEQAGVRWGLHEAQRSSLDLPVGFAANTWQFGLRRMFLGYAVGEGQAWQDVQPFAPVSGLEGALAGKLQALMLALERLWEQFRCVHTVAAWADNLRAMCDLLFDAEDESDRFILLRFQEAIHDWQMACSEGGIENETLPLLVVRESLLSALDSEGLSQRFLAGCVNFCTLMPMRSIPFRVVCLLGMNDGEYPRSRKPMDFDLMAGRYRPGDRSRRDDDRYLFLEALLSARQVFYVSHVGRSIRDDSTRPPSVLVAQLRDYLEAAYCLESDDQEVSSALLDSITFEHPLQPFSARYFGVDPRFFSYAEEWRNAHNAPAGNAANVLPELRLEFPLSLAQIENFLREPVEWFYATRLEVSQKQEEEADFDNETFSIDALQSYEFGKELIEAARLDAVSFDETVARWRREGRIPVAQWGALATHDLYNNAKKVWDSLESIIGNLHALQEPLEIRVPTDFPRVEDWASSLYCDNSTPERPPYRMLEWRPSKSRGKINKGAKYHYFIRLWVAQVCLAAQGIEVESVLIAADKVYRLPPISKERALQQLALWIQAMEIGINQPLAINRDAALGYWRVRLGKIKNVDAALAEAAKIFEAQDKYSNSQLERHPLFWRCYPEWSRMSEGFERWATELYGDLVQWVHSEAGGDAHDDAE
ncbi:Exonuclease V gamma-subunit [gamma proteobacterium HdN1]|nr:Exonuclease V gamma-subunit [gamma proteobacterium HdN1]